MPCVTTQLEPGSVGSAGVPRGVHMGSVDHGGRTANERRKSQGGPPQATALIGWVFLDRHRQEGFTIRWRRGEQTAYVLDGQRVGDHAMAGVLATIPVLPEGWTDLAEIRLLGQRWLRRQAGVSR